ncbi:hypothetical protein [Segniliparus rugosus]|uniref:Uncharacterized protein n=1 Tax=Segniliparus rugosus (strain ATCC BAA-974 / DSM 45345 / CCUG 50838 / CIP 108380 / JCM 13579 / CDC 945) TaxID=679197 RepID=E5XRV5_SEGRC|nr:hypothetical protein [Segniliparus rugosus]EFV12970.1 hypothetical protein HMPREF9336_02227 [Segniliparus rugosus ATCC BAA-974]
MPEFSLNVLKTWKPETLIAEAARLGEKTDAFAEINNEIADLNNRAAAQSVGTAADARYEYLKATTSFTDDKIQLMREEKQIWEEAGHDLAAKHNRLFTAVQAAMRAGFVVNSKGGIEGDYPRQSQELFDKHAEAVGRAKHELEQADEHHAQKIREISGRIKEGTGGEPHKKKDWLTFGGEHKDDPGVMPTSPKHPGVNTAQFEKLYGRAPQSDSDWKMAQILDTNTLVGRNNGVPAKVTVGHIKPVPGQGIVRVGLYIPANNVFNLPFNDLGDDRGPNDQFDPRQTRVSIYIDYENGVVVARQNPSIGTNEETEVQDPTVNVQQTSDGRVRVHYDATNPLAPPGSHMGGLSVNGDITLTPTENGVQIDGRVGDYPSMEVYQDRQGTTTTAYDYQATGSEFGPMANLRPHHDVGAGDPGPLQETQPGYQQWDGPGIPSHTTQVNVPGQEMTLGPENADNPPHVDPVAPSSQTPQMEGAI